MRVNRKNFSQLMDGSVSSLPSPDSLSKGAGRKVLVYEQPPIHLPGLGVIILSSHSKEQIFKHLLAKWVYEGFLRKSELLIGAILTATSRDTTQIILNFIVSYKILNKIVRLQLWDQLLPFVNHLPEDPQRYLNAFEPEIFILRVWRDRKRFPAKRYIGIGYSDHGTLSTTLAWQEQMVGEEELEVPSAKVKLILSSFVAAASPS
jgi:hypothetical protein